MADEKRRTERIEILGEMPGAATVAKPVAIRELSRSGASVESSFPLHIDTLHQFRLTLGDQTVVVRGRVAHCHISDVDHERVTYIAGIDFVELGDAASHVITTFLEDLKAGRRG